MADFFVFVTLFFLPVTLAPRMRLLLLPCLLLLSVPTFTAGEDFLQGAEALGQSRFVKRSFIEEKAAKIAKRSLPAWLAASSKHRIKRRSVEQGDTCHALQGFETKLAGNTHNVSYPVRSCYSLLNETRGCAGVNQVHHRA